MQDIRSRKKENLIPILGSSSSSSAAIAMAYSSSATVMAPHPPPPPKYDVFLSFRGQDTRENFTSHLYAELCRKRIETFIDNKLDRGDEISPELYKAIEESMFYVIIISENYASSSWCLNELVKILECRKSYGRDVIPIFYKVDPSNVRHQKGSFADAFVKHELRFKDEVTQKWKDVLTKVAGISGWDSNSTSPESMLVDGIVQDILRKLDRSISSDHTQGIVGIDKHIEQIQSLLQLESEAVRIIGIWGMGGIGKTTLAEALYLKLGIQFSSRSCVLNAQQEIDRVGTRSLRKKYLSELLDEGNISNELSFSNERVKRAKVLLILDDVKNSSQIQELIGGHGNFGKGSRIIVTSRDMQVLKNAEADGIYQVKEMNYQDSQKLFSLYAFKPNSPGEVNADLVDKVLKCAKGIPIALKVLGSLLYGRTRKVWESQLEKLEKFPNHDIFNVLKLSYDGLDDEEKGIFLDIACYYVGYGVEDAMEMLDVFGFSADFGMVVLKDRGLISILHNRIVMHDLIWEMGREIVRQQCIHDPGKRSRLWKDEETYNVLRKNEGTDAIQCIFLDMSKIKEVQLHPEIFKSMPNLRMLHFRKRFFREQVQSNVALSTFLESLPNGLKFLHWVGFPQKTLPVDFCAENLAILNMRHSHLEQLWDDDQELPNLKRLDLRNSLKLIRISDLSKLPKIEEILLSGCESLIQVYSSSFLCNLKCLWLNGCVELTDLNLHSNILSRSSGLVGFYNCCKLKTFSIYKTNVVESHGGSHLDDVNPKGTSGYQHMNERSLVEKYLKDLEFFRETVTPSRYSHELCWLDLGSCKSLTSLPIGIYKLKLLRRLELSGCSNLEKFPEIEETMENLAVLVLDQTAIQELPSSLHHLVGLEELSLRGCLRLKIIPSSIGGLTKLSKLDLDECESLETFPSSIFKLKLTKLDLTGCSMLETFPEILEPAESFACIKLNRTAIRVLPSSLHHLVGLEELSLHACSMLEMIPSSIERLTKLCKLDLTDCESLENFPSIIFKLNSRILDLRCFSKLKTLPEILEPAESVAHLNLEGTTVKALPSSLDRLVGLQTLYLRGCRDLESLPNSIGNLKLLSQLYCSGCVKLTEIPNGIGGLSSLRDLSLNSTGIVNLPESMAHLSSLESLNLSGTRIVNLPYIIAHLSSLKSLNLSDSGIVNLPESIAHLSSLELLDVSDTGIANLPDRIADLSRLKSLDVSQTRIASLPQSIAHLSSLKSLDVSECKNLECIPQLPLFLEELEAYDCPSITRVVPNSRIKHPSDSKVGTITFNFHLTNNEEENPCVHRDVVADAEHRFTEGAYKFVFYCFPGSAVPNWFPYRCKGNSVTVDKDSLNWCNDKRLIGFALSVVLLPPDMNDLKYSFRDIGCRVALESGGYSCILPINHRLNESFGLSCRMGHVMREHTFLWKYFLDSARIYRENFHTLTFTFAFQGEKEDSFTFGFGKRWLKFESGLPVKECGICPLYTKIK